MAITIHSRSKRLIREKFKRLFKFPYKISKTWKRNRFAGNVLQLKKRLIKFSYLCIILSVLTVLILFAVAHIYVNKYLESIINFSTVARVTDYYITRPNSRDDGGVVRVIFAIVSTRIDWMLCYAVASAYFTNIPIAVIGYKKENYNNVYKPEMYLSAAEQAGLRDSDVVLALDSDIMFTGLDYLPFVDKFIKLSPANLNELDAKAIRSGQMMAPSLYGTEGGCYAPQTIALTWKECHIAYEQLYKKHNEYVSSLTEFAEKPFVNYEDNKLQHLNSGVSIQRVWSMRKLFSAFHKYIATNSPIRGNYWYSDQSVFAKFYLELRLWEIEQDYFRKSTNELRTMHNKYGLYAGLMGLDINVESSATIYGICPNPEFKLVDIYWPKVSDTAKRNVNVCLKDKKLWLKKLFLSSIKEKRLTKRKLTRSYSNVHSVTIAPPLLSVVPRHINGKDKPAERVFPLILHFAAIKKEKRENDALSYMQWSLPMMFDKEKWKRGKQYAMSMPIEMLTDNNDKLHLQESDVCAKYDLFGDIR